MITPVMFFWIPKQWTILDFEQSHWRTEWFESYWTSSHPEHLKQSGDICCCSTMVSKGSSNEYQRQVASLLQIFVYTDVCFIIKMTHSIFWKYPQVVVEKGIIICGQVLMETDVNESGPVPRCYTGRPLVITNTRILHYPLFFSASKSLTKRKLLAT